MPHDSVLDDKYDIKKETHQIKKKKANIVAFRLEKPYATKYSPF